MESDWKIYEKPHFLRTPSITTLIYVSPNFINGLQRLAVDEPDWRVTDARGSKPKLFNYLDHTFRQCLSTGKVLTTIVEDKQQFLLFATGLMTVTHEMIYCICGPNLYPQKESPDRIFSIYGFLDTFQLCGNNKFSIPPISRQDLPEIATYGNLKFDATIPLPDERINFHHLLREGNIKDLGVRLSKNWQQKLLEQEPKAVFGDLRQQFRKAIIKVLSKIKQEDASATIVARQYCRTRNEVQFLLPLNLTEPEKSVDEPECVLTVRLEKQHNYYEAVTILPLPNARSNARLLGEVTQEWLAKSCNLEVLSLKGEEKQKPVSWRRRC